jgi:hypothetical protein
MIFIHEDILAFSHGWLFKVVTLHGSWDPVLASFVLTVDELWFQLRIMMPEVRKKDVETVVTRKKCRGDYSNAIIAGIFQTKWHIQTQYLSTVLLQAWGIVIIFLLAQRILTVSDQPTDIIRIKSLP